MDEGHPQVAFLNMEHISGNHRGIGLAKLLAKILKQVSHVSYIKTKVSTSQLIGCISCLKNAGLRAGLATNHPHPTLYQPSIRPGFSSPLKHPPLYLGLTPHGFSSPRTPPPTLYHPDTYLPLIYCQN